MIPRYTIPDNNDPYYTITSYGGLNECIAGSPAAWTGSALANCVGYCWGRAYEAMKRRPTLSKGNASGWYAYNDGYSRGSEPRIGSIMCWSGGDEGAGHVAFVEAIENGAVKTSNSWYEGISFYIQNYPIGNYNMAGYTFEGFIYLPINDNNAWYIFFHNRRF